MPVTYVADIRDVFDFASLITHFAFLSEHRKLRYDIPIFILDR